MQYQRQSIIAFITSAFARVGLGVFAAKTLSLLSFYIAGTVLTPAQVGTYSLVVGTFGILLSYQAGSVGPLLIERRVFVDGKYLDYSSYATTANVIMAGIACIFLLYTTNIYNNEQIFIATAMILNGLVSAGQTFQRARLSTGLKFGQLALFDTRVATIQAIIFIIALLFLRDVSAYAFIYVALFVVNIIWGIRADCFSPPSLSKFIKISKSGIFLVLSTIMTHGTNLAPYAIVASMQTRSLAGEFYFASHLILSLGILFQKPLQSTILPIAKELESVNSHAVQHIGTTLGKLSLFMSFLACIIIALIEHAVVLIWNDKWIGAASVCSFAVAAVFSRICSSTVISLLEASSRWKAKFIITSLEFSAIITICLLANIYFQNLFLISISIFLGHAITSLVLQIYIGKIIQLRLFMLYLSQLLVMVAAVINYLLFKVYLL